MKTTHTRPATTEDHDITPYRVSDSFPPSVRSIAPEDRFEDLFPPREPTASPQHQRAVRHAGLSIIALAAGAVIALAGSTSARGAMVAWGTAGDVRHPVHAAAAAAPAAAAPIPEAPTVEAPAAPAVEPPAPAPAAQDPAPKKATAPGPMPAARRYVDDPY